MYVHILGKEPICVGNNVNNMTNADMEYGISPKKIVVVGAGAAGMMAAVTAARLGADVTVVEKNDRPGKKLRITGKGRCNLTNDCSVQDFMANVPQNPRFLYTSLSKFSVEDVKSFFEDAGVPLKVERGNRVFPVSDKAADVVDALFGECKKAGVKFLFNKKTHGVNCENGRAVSVKCSGGDIKCDAVILACGGASYPLTGSDGDGFRMASALGHTVTRLRPSLVPIVEDGTLCREMQGLSLKNVGLKITAEDSGRVVYQDFGEMMFTHFGLTGPMILSASAYIGDIDKNKYIAEIDLKPALDEKKLDTRLLSDFAKYSNRDFLNSLSDLLPQKMIEPTVRLSGIDGRKKVNSITREERARLCEVLKHFKVRLSHFRPMAEAIVTRGGVAVGEIDPRTMGSKLVEGLYFAGEMIDVDAYTGGFNLQIAFSTGYTAGESVVYG